MFHVNNNDEAKPCRAKTPENCRFYKGEDDSRHYESVADAQVFIEAKLSKENGGTLEKKVRYSFVKEFKKQEEKFNEEFEGIPNRFFNADLRGKFAKPDDTEAELNLRYMNIRGLGTRLLTSLSAPSDNGIDDEKAIKLLTDQGFEDIQEIHDEKLLKGFKSNRAWKVRLEDKDAIVLDGNAGTEINSYRFRMPNEYFKGYANWHKLDLRKVAGNARAEKKTGINVLKTIMNTESVNAESKKFKATNQAIVDAVQDSDEVPEHLKNEIIIAAKKADYQKSAIAAALMKLEDAQLEGSNFIAQKKYVKEHSSKIATVWEDKKDTDDIRKDLIKNSTVKDIFRKIDLDNDVDPGEYKNFEKDLNDVKSKLPSIPKGMEPELRLRKLGKHSSSSFTVNGLYNPVRNSIGISVENSASTIHELMHFYDLTVKNNASLSGEFREISKEYMKGLKMPEGLGNKKEYYSVATEQLARGGEIWASERLGIDNRLLDKEKFKSFDYAPFMENPQLKEKVFKFFDKLFEEDKNN